MSGKELIIDSCKIKYVEKIKGDEPMIVFLHGWGSNYNSFSSIYKSLNNYLAFDFPGFGGSSKIKKVWTLSDYAELTKKIIDKKSDGRKIVFVAHSFGGRVLLKLLNQYDVKNVEQIICIGVPFVREYGVNKKIVYLFTKTSKPFLDILPKYIKRKFKIFWYKVIGAGDYLELNDENMRKTFENVIDEDIFKLTAVLGKFKTDLIWGSDDKEALLSGAKKVSSQTEAKLHIIDNGGHFPFAGQTSAEFMKVFKKIVDV